MRPIQLEQGLGVLHGGSIFAPLRISRVSVARTSTSAGDRFAMCSGSNPPSASVVPGHFAFTTRRLIPDWKTARVSTSR